MATLVVVGRDASGTFHHLQATWAPKLGCELTVMWDRRISDRRRYEDSIPVERRVRERREPQDGPLDNLDEARRGNRRRQAEWQPPERRQAERRRRPPDTWGTLGLLMAHDDERPL